MARLTEKQKATILRHARQDAIEHLELIRDDLEDERRESLMTVLDYVAELEKTTAARNEDIGRLQNELGKAKARIAELEAAQQWQPMNKEIYRDGLVKVLLYDNQMQVNFDDKTPIMVYLDNDVRMCRKIQPAA